MHNLVSLLDSSGDGSPCTLEQFDENQVRWAVESGLGPLLREALRDDPRAPQSPHWPLIEGATLRAKVVVGQQIDAMVEIIDACEGHFPPLTLLKGISMCEQYYARPEFRPMRDLDFLVEERAVSAMERILEGLGYRPQAINPPAFYSTHHHCMPFLHPGTDVWVEIHHGLFPPASALSTDEVFSQRSISRQRRASEFRGRSVYRLADELQIVYIACHWGRHFKVADGVIGLLDMIQLLNGRREGVRWEEILVWVDGSMASIHLYVLLTYLSRHRLVDVPVEILEKLRRKQRALGRAGLAIIHSLIDRHIVTGRAFGKVMTKRSAEIVWETLQSPGSSLSNLLRLPWEMFAARLRPTEPIVGALLLCLD
jgi:hypothetical protein